MAIVKATYTKQKDRAKASIRYIQNRPGRDGAKESRTLFDSDGYMERQEAYNMIDQAKKGTTYFRFVISPDPAGEDTGVDLNLREVTQRTMQTLEEKLHRQVAWTELSTRITPRTAMSMFWLLFRPDSTQSIFNFLGRKQLKPAASRDGNLI